ncbi:MAG TPA: alpha/beta fold hydrolase [Bryobacteraceae bacterium]|nr:alpha/beta fold hydrolase [Bryobacteraceae bacterium]
MSEVPNKLFQFGPFVLDAEQKLLQKGSRTVPISPKALDLLCVLVSHAGRMLSKDELIARVWRDTFVEENNLSQNISQLRRLLGQQPGQEYIETVPRRGYRFAAEVTVVEAAQKAQAAVASVGTPDLHSLVEVNEFPTTRYARSGDVNIAYQVLGDGPLDLVFVMGWVSHLEYFWKEPSFARFLRRLASFSRLVLFDKRGTGLSDRVPIHALPTLEQRMQDVRAVLDAVGSERAVICGVSEGGPMSALFAATYPERTSALIMIGTYAKRVRDAEYPWGPTAEERDAFLEEIETHWGGPIGIDERAPSKAGDPKFRDWWSAYLRMGASPGAAVALTRMNAQIDVRNVLPTIHVPTLVLHRTGDRCLKVEEGRYVASLVPGAKLLELPGEDHLPFTGNQEDVLEAIEDFLCSTVSGAKAQRVLATVLSASIGKEGWSPGDQLSHFEPQLRRELEWFGGHDLRSPGSANVLAAFDGPARAIRCACVLTAHATRLGIPLSAGLHTGECDRFGPSDLRGPAVEIATEIASRTPPGEVIVSRTVRDLVAGSGIEFTAHGVLALGSGLGEWPLLRVQRS